MEAGDISTRTCAEHLRSGRYLLAGLGGQGHVGHISSFDWAGLRTRMGDSPSRANGEAYPLWSGFQAP